MPKILSHGKSPMRFGKESNRSSRCRSVIRARLTNAAPAGGRKPIPARRIFEAILCTCCAPVASGKPFPQSASVVQALSTPISCVGYVLVFFVSLWRNGLAEYDEMEGIAWSWQSIDGAMVKAPLAQEAVGRNPTDRGEKKEPSGIYWWTAVVSRCHSS